MNELDYCILLPEKFAAALISSHKNNINAMI